MTAEEKPVITEDEPETAQEEPVTVKEEPVEADYEEYDVFITPGLAQEIYLLQHVNRNRDKGYNARNASCPTEVRIKPNAGYLEVDTIMNTSKNFNKYKGLQWGDAMKNAHATQGNTTFGPASGLAPAGRSGRSVAVARGQKDDVSRENELQNKLVAYEDSVNKNYVHHAQTLGGQILPASEGLNTPKYMLGAFRNSQLHLTRVDGIVQMRPQFHHVDAESQRQRQTVPREETTIQKPVQPPKSVLQTFAEHKVEKKPEDVTRDLLRTAQEEAWVKMQYFDEDESAAYSAYNGKLFAQKTEGASDLNTKLGDERYLDAVAAPRNNRNPRKRKRLPIRQATETEDVDDEAEGVAVKKAVPGDG